MRWKSGAAWALRPDGVGSAYAPTVSAKDGSDVPRPAAGMAACGFGAKTGCAAGVDRVAAGVFAQHNGSLAAAEVTDDTPRAAAAVALDHRFGPDICWLARNMHVQFPYPSGINTL